MEGPQDYTERDRGSRQSSFPLFQTLSENPPPSNSWQSETMGKDKIIVLLWTKSLATNILLLPGQWHFGFSCQFSVMISNSEIWLLLLPWGGIVSVVRKILKEGQDRKMKTVQMRCWNTIRVGEELEHNDKRENESHLCRNFFGPESKQEFSWAREGARRIRLQ